MAASDEIKKLNSEIKEIQKALGKTSNFKVFSSSNMGEAKTFLRGLKEELGDIESNLKGLQGIFTANLGEIQKTNISLNNSKKALRGLAS